MKKKIFSGFLAAVLAMSMTVTAFAANEVTDFENGTDVGGSGTVLAVSDIFDVIVPTNVNYAINPAELSGKPQVMSGSFGVINHGSTAVKVDVTASIADSTTVTISDADTIDAVNNATDAADVVEDALMYLAVAPVKAGATVTAETVVGADAHSKVGFDVVNDVAEGSSVAISNGGASLAFKLPPASYTATITGSAITTGGGFDTSGVEAVQEYTGDFTNDPVAAFTLVGSVNKYADWTAITLPEVTLTFDFAKLNTLAYDALEVDPATENMVAGGATGDVATTAFISADDDNGIFWLALMENKDDDSNGGLVGPISNVKVNGIATNSTIGSGWLQITYDDAKAVGAVTDDTLVATVTFTCGGTAYTATYDWNVGGQVFPAQTSSAVYITQEANYDIWVGITTDETNGGLTESKISNVKIDGAPCAYSFSYNYIYITSAQLTAAGLSGDAASFTVSFTHDGVNYEKSYTWQ